jgi:hypothetical protein
MIGGVVTSAILELLLYPAIYSLWRRRHLAPLAEGGAPALPGAGASPPRRWSPALVGLLIGAAIIGGYEAWRASSAKAPAPESAATGVPFASKSVNGLTVAFYHSKGQLQSDDNDVLLEFRDGASGKRVDVGTVRFDLDMNMPGMAMHSGSTVTADPSPGLYHVKVHPEMAGDWVAQLRYDGPRGSGSVDFTVSVAQ